MAIGATPAYVGMSEGWFYEIVWEWSGSHWIKRADSMTYKSYSPVDPCGAFNPLALAPNFTWAPPYRLYETWRYVALSGQWERCYTQSNW
jgi:hypothetical protein